MLVIWMYFEWRDLDRFPSLGVFGAELNKVGVTLRAFNLEKDVTLTKYRWSSQRHRLQAGNLACPISVFDSALKGG